MDWQVLDAAGAKTEELSNPFETAIEVASDWLKSLERTEEPLSPWSLETEGGNLLPSSSERRIP